ncbi:hypothetical protein IJ380_01180 [Candidatus Saccharibacteria bacterium]|nr:hypothetical protein [Candidatus Saccharibacteria bacterium]
MGLFGGSDYCLRDTRTGESQTFSSPDEAALFIKMHDGHVTNAGGTDTLERLGQLGYDTKGNKSDSGFFSRLFG